MTGLGHGVGAGQVRTCTINIIPLLLLRQAVAIEMLITAVLIMIVFAAAADQFNAPGVKASPLIGHSSQ